MMSKTLSPKTFKYPYVVLTLKKTFTAKYMAFCPEHPKWDQNRKITPLSETTSIPAPFHMGVPPGASNFSLYDQCVIKQVGH